MPDLKNSYAECSGECDECEYRTRINTRRGWSIPEFWEEYKEVCLLEVKHDRRSGVYREL